MSHHTEVRAQEKSLRKGSAKPPPAVRDPREAAVFQSLDEPRLLFEDPDPRASLPLGDWFPDRREHARRLFTEEPLPEASDMVQVRRILVPVDFTPKSAGVARYAASLVREFNSEVVFVHAVQNRRADGGVRKDSRDMLTGIQGSTPSRILICEGEPVPVILEAARMEAADLILMPTRGMPKLSRLFDRSITAQVLRAAHCPVWAGVDDLTDHSARPIRNILCGISLGPRTGIVLRWAANLARRLSATLTVVHTSKGLQPMPSYPSDGEWRLRIEKAAREDISALQKAAGTHADVWLEPGPALTAIPPLAETLHADLLVIGKSPQRRLLGDLRTTSYDLVCKAPCPVVSV